MLFSIIWHIQGVGKYCPMRRYKKVILSNRGNPKKRIVFRLIDYLEFFFRMIGNLLDHLFSFYKNDCPFIWYKGCSEKMRFFSKNFHYFATSPSIALGCYWLHRNWPNWPANRGTCTLLLRWELCKLLRAIHM